MYQPQHKDPWPLERERNRSYRAAHARAGAVIRALRGAVRGAVFIAAAVLWPEHVLYARLNRTAP